MEISDRCAADGLASESTFAGCRCCGLHPVFINLMHDYFLPDLMFAALVAVFFVLVSLEYWMAAAVLMLPLFAVTTAIPVSRSSLCE